MIVMYNNIIIKGAREHNLKNIDVKIPKNKLIVITGVSGSGKSTLAFDTIYADGQRRYVESLSAYARQFLGMMKKPDVDSIEGLSPAISIEQKSTSKNPRSTVGTITEVYDYLRLLYARIGIAYCPEHNIKIESMSPQKISENIIKDFNNKNIIILAPVIEQKKGTYEKLIEDINKEGFSRVRVNNKIYRSEEKIELERYKKHNIEIVIDRIKIEKNNKESNSRLVEAIENANKESKTGLIKILYTDNKNKEQEKIYSTKMACPVCGLAYEELQPRMFSFNSPFGACQECSGLGIKMEFDENLIIPDKSIGILDGAIKVYRNVMDGWRTQHLLNVAKANGFDGFTAINKLSKKQYNTLIYGSKQKIKFTVKKSDGSGAFMHTGSWEGIIPQLERLYKQTESDYRRKELSKFMKVLPCNKCKGKRLKKKILSIKIKNKNIIELTDLSIKEAINFFKNLKLNTKEQKIAKHILKEINYRLEFLEKVGLGYLTLSRSSATLSGGEAQRIRLATNLGTNLTGVLYVLDEPSIGLHQRDNQKLIDTLKKLRDLGNTLIVVEHDEDTIRQADYVIDIGPGAGIHGGKIVAAGTPKQIENNKDSLTGRYLSGIHEIKVPKSRRKFTNYIELKGASENNLKNININIPIGVLNIITGVSGSGKSTLINETLYKEAMNRIYKSKFTSGKHKSLNLKNIDKVIAIDQSPIGRTPRSNPATYTKLFDEIRNVFANTLEAKTRGYKAGRFSFNVKDGRCQACNGEGQIKIEMNFLPDVYVDCEECNGTRYNKETLEVKYKGKNIAQVLDMSVEEAYYFFENIPKIKRKLQTLMDVGLSYIKLGQSSVTLSGGEAQRIKITRELSKIGSGNTLYILDEPTTGLHFHDVNKLIEVLNRLVDKGNTVVVIEHNLDVIKCADYIIDLGLEGGNEGGQIIAQGNPEEIITNKKSFTAQYLKDYLKLEKTKKTNLK